MNSKLKNKMYVNLTYYKLILPKKCMFPQFAYKLYRCYIFCVNFLHNIYVTLYYSS